MPYKCCTHCPSKFGKFSSGHRAGKDQLSFKSQRKAMPNKVQTTAQMFISVQTVRLNLCCLPLQRLLCSLKSKNEIKVNFHTLFNNFEISLQKNACGL